MHRLLLSLVVVVASASAVGCASTKAWEPDARSGNADPSRAYDTDEIAVETASADSGGGFFDVFGGSDAPSSAPMKTASMAPPAPPPVPPQEASAPTTTTELATTPENDAKPIEAAKRLVIYTGSLLLMVPSADVAVAAFVEQVTGLGGHLQSRSSTTVTVRVPAAQFFPVIDALRRSGTVTNEQINAQDVTKRVFDIELRLSTAEESRKRLVDILKSATRIEDILRIETEIRRLTDEIEGMKGELRNLGDQVAFSTLTVAFYANAPAPRPYPDRTQSRFEWINQVGVEQVLYGF